ncbi:hypothetical protein Tco_0765636 [Tanacetum coccineum]
MSSKRVLNAVLECIYVLSADVNTHPKEPSTSERTIPAAPTWDELGRMQPSVIGVSLVVPQTPPNQKVPKR